MTLDTRADNSDPSWGFQLRQAASKFSWQDRDIALRDAKYLLAHALNTTTDRLTLFLQDQPDANHLAKFQVLVAKRIERQPVSHIINRREFYGRDYYVDESVLDPRPETETLVDIALRTPFERALDLGTGSGCILLTLLSERSTASGIGTDLSQAALDTAARNAATLGIAPERIELQQSDWFDSVAGQFDLIVSNPPYIAAIEMDGLSPEVLGFEPLIALTPGGDGLDAYRAIASDVMEFLTPGGRLIVEIGPTQADDLHRFFGHAGLVNITTYQDLDGRDRVVSAEKPRNNQP